VGEAYGGGAAYCTLNNCTLTGNVVEAPLLYNSNYQGYEGYSGYSAGDAYGGGAAFCSLNNCTLTGNRAQDLFVTLIILCSIIGEDMAAKREGVGRIGARSPTAH